MKKLFTLSLVAFMMVATMCVSSCSTAKSVNKAFEKNGYVMTALTPAQQIEVCPVVAKFPHFLLTLLVILLWVALVHSSMLWTRLVGTATLLSCRMQDSLTLESAT